MVAVQGADLGTVGRMPQAHCPIVAAGGEKGAAPGRYCAHCTHPALVAVFAYI
jgi:hypothetical protein